MWEYLFYIIIGAAAGSFVNVLAARTVAGKSISTPRSFCDACARPIARRDLIPVLSFFLLRARCRYCRARLSWQYPIVEAATAALFLAGAMVASGPAELLMFWLAITVLITLFLTDLRAMVLPDHITLPAIAVFLIMDIVFLNRAPGPLILAVALGGLFFLLQYVLSRGRWVGGGDIRFGVLMAAILASWQGVLEALAISYILGALVGIFMIIGKKKKLKSEVPLGVFLALGTLVVMFGLVDFDLVLAALGAL